jgi:hypothetical protein
MITVYAYMTKTWIMVYDVRDEKAAVLFCRAAQPVRVVCPRTPKIAEDEKASIVVTNLLAFKIDVLQTTLCSCARHESMSMDDGGSRGSGKRMISH